MPALLPAHLATLARCATPDDFKLKVWELLGPALRDYECTGTDVLFVTYVEPEQTAGGIFKADKSQQEVLFQGTVGLVVGVGPLVGKFDGSGNAWLPDQRTPKIGDWIVARFADCWEMHLDGASCRLIDPENIRGFITRPEIITHRPAQSIPPVTQMLKPTYIGGQAANALPYTTSPSIVPAMPVPAILSKKV